MSSPLLYMAMENIKTGETVGVNPYLGGLLRSSPGKDIPIGVALRDIYAGETVEYIPNGVSGDISSSTSFTLESINL